MKYTPINPKDWKNHQNHSYTALDELQERTMTQEQEKELEAGFKDGVKQSSIPTCEHKDENDDKTFTIREVKEKISELENKTKVEGFETCKELHQAQNDIQVLKRVLVLLK